MRALACAALAAALLLTLAPAAGAAERQAPKRFVGVMWDREIQDAPRGIQAEQWAAMAASGVETARVIFSWELAQEKTKSRPPSFALTDVMVEEAARHGIELLPVVTYAPPWARVVQHPASAPKDVKAYQAYLKALVRRYGPGGEFWASNPDVPELPVRLWQVWNEPPLDWQFQPHKGWAERYGAILRQASSTIKKADPGARVVLSGLANNAWDAIDTLYRKGGIRGHFDVATLHMYSKKPEEFVAILKRFRAALDRNGARDTEIFVTEAGASASADAIEAPQQAHFQTSHRKLASLIPATFKRLARLRERFRLERIYWYTWASTYTPDTFVFGYSGLNAYRPDSELVWAMPALEGFRKMAEALEGCRKDTRARCL